MINSTERKPFVSYLSKKDERFAQKFAKQHGLKFITPRNLRISDAHKLVIWISEGKISFQDLSLKNSKPFKLNYLNFKKINSESSLLKKCFSQKDIGKKVIDLTGGYCIDALEISSMGFSVTAFEKKTWLYEFTKQCLSNISHTDLKDSSQRINFICGDSLKLANKFRDHEIVYLDHMFEIKNDARAKKEIQFLRNLDLNDFDFLAIIKLIEKKFIKKIIYKSALHTDTKSLINLNPSRVIKGKAFKYSIFHIDQETL